MGLVKIESILLNNNTNVQKKSIYIYMDSVEQVGTRSTKSIT